MLAFVSKSSFISRTSIFLLITALFCGNVFSLVKKNPQALETDRSVLTQCDEIQFRQAPEFPVGANPKGVAAADFDGDGRTDIAVSFSMGGYGFSILRNLGANGFAPKQDFVMPSGVPVSSVFTKDLDADGKSDIVITYDFERKISVFRNISPSPGTIDFAPRNDYTGGGFQARSVAFGDVDGDGNPDVIVGTADTETGISVFRNLSNGSGTIALAPKVDFPVPIQVKVLTLSDFDGDGKLDVAVSGGGVRVLQNTGSGVGNINFAASPTSYDIPNAAFAIVTGDFDGDGRQDIVTANSIANNISVLRNTSSAAGINFAAAQNIDSGLAAWGAVTSDFDGDGKIDIAVISNSGNSLSVLRNTSSAAGIINFAPRAWDFGTGISPYAVATADFNSDGKVDIVTANREGNTASVLINNNAGAGNIDFAARKDYLTPLKAGVTNISSADFDNDGNLDLAASFEETRNVFRFSIYRNDGTGHFPTTIDFSPAPPAGVSNMEPFYVTAGDFDGDGKVDVAMLGSWKNQLSQTVTGLRIYRNTSSGPGNFNFSTTAYSAVFPSPAKLFVTDLDNDGKNDIVATHRPDSNETALIFRNTSNGIGSVSFAQTSSFVMAGAGINIYPGDLNLDARPDLLHGNPSFVTPPITVQINAGSSPGEISFSPQNIPPQGTGYGETVIVDIDGDSKKDLVSENGYELSVLKNTSAAGSLSFAQPIIFSNFFVKPTAVGDLDSDGKMDVITESTGVGNSFISVLRNTSSGNGGPIDFSVGEKFAIGGSTNVGKITSRITSDFNNDGRLDVVTTFSGITGSVSVLLNQKCSAVVIKAPFDFDGDGKTDIGIFRPSAGEWWINRSSNGTGYALQFGASSDKLTPVDFTGDGKTDVAFFRPATGEWFVLRSEDNSFYAFPFGANGDIPAPADFDADGKADAAVFRPSTATWYIRRSSDNGTTIQTFGQTGDVPVVADYDGDDRADIAIYRVAAGEWWINRSTAGGIAFQFGNSNDKPVVGDYTGDGKAEVAFFRPSTGEWFVLRSENQSYYSFPFGASGDIPAPGDYDGDGKFDATVFRSSANTWYSQRTTAGILIQTFGQNGDIPVPSAFVP